MFSSRVSLSFLEHENITISKNKYFNCPQWKRPDRLKIGASFVIHPERRYPSITMLCDKCWCSLPHYSLASQLITAKTFIQFPVSKWSLAALYCLLHVVLFLGWSQLTLFWIKEPPFDCQYVFATRQKEIFMVIWQESRQIENFKTDLHKNVYL